MQLLTYSFLCGVAFCMIYRATFRFSEHFKFQMCSNDILRARIYTKSDKISYRKNGYKFEFEFQIFVQRKVWVMGFQELCLLCYETQRLRHSQVGRVAQSLLWPPGAN